VRGRTRVRLVWSRWQPSEQERGEGREGKEGAADRQVGVCVPAQLLAEEGGKHGHHLLNKVDGRAAPGRLLVQGRVLAHEE